MMSFSAARLRTKGRFLAIYVRDKIISRLCQTSAGFRQRYHRRGKPHPLPGELIVSLTSYPARFPTLHLTLACLLDQSVKPDRVILWIAYEDMAMLPASVLELQERGLEIRSCEDLRSYKKLIPALEAFPHAFIATADDDLYYRVDWLKELVEGLTSEGDVITCHRAHRMKQTPNGPLLPYLEWQFDVQDEHSRRPSDDLLPTGVGGMLYPPQSLDPCVTQRQLFRRLCPGGDDLWFYWCARMAGTRFKKVGGKLWLLNWPGSQQTSLWAVNEAGGNDAMIAALQEEFGYLR
jgi:hypothetical protein